MFSWDQNEGRDRRWAWWEQGAGGRGLLPPCFTPRHSFSKFQEIEDCDLAFVLFCDLLLAFYVYAPTAWNNLQAALQVLNIVPLNNFKATRLGCPWVSAFFMFFFFLVIEICDLNGTKKGNIKKTKQRKTKKRVAEIEIGCEPSNGARIRWVGWPTFFKVLNHWYPVSIVPIHFKTSS